MKTKHICVEIMFYHRKIVLVIEDSFIKIKKHTSSLLPIKPAPNDRYAESSRFAIRIRL